MQAISDPLRFRIQAVSSSAAVKKQVHPSFRTASLIREIFCSELSPAYFSGCTQIPAVLRGGRSFQTRPGRSRSIRQEPQMLSNSSVSSLPWPAPKSGAKNAGTSSLPRFWRRKADKDGTFFSPIFMRVMPLPSSSFSACSKYLPSVQRYASFSVTSSIQESPVNPLRNRTHWSCSPMYSLPWASLHGLIHAVIPSSFMALRSAVSSCLIFSLRTVRNARRHSRFRCLRCRWSHSPPPPSVPLFHCPWRCRWPPPR